MLTAAELVNLLRAKFPQFADRLPKRDLSGSLGTALVKFGSYFEKSKGTASFMHAQVGKGTLAVDNSKSVKELDIKYVSAADAIVASVQNSIKWKHIKDSDHNKKNDDHNKKDNDQKKEEEKKDEKTSEEEK